jgi:hypothetical protein
MKSARRLWTWPVLEAPQALICSAGEAQASVFVLRRITSDSAYYEMYLDGVSERISLPAQSTWAFEILIVGRGGNDSAGYQIRGLIENNNGVTALVGSPSTLILGEDVSEWDAKVEVVAGANAPAVLVRGSAGKQVRWVARMHTVECNVY